MRLRTPWSLVRVDDEQGPDGLGVDLEHGKDDVTDQSGVGADPDIFSGRRAGWPTGKGAAYGTHLKHQEQMQ